MKVYELQFRDGDNFDESSFVLRVKTDGHLEAPGAVICKEIEIKPYMSGIDLIISNELTEDDVVTVRKTLIKDIIIDLRKTLITDTAHSSVGRVKDMHSDIVKAVDRLYQILNEDIS